MKNELVYYHLPVFINVRGSFQVVEYFKMLLQMKLCYAAGLLIILAGCMILYFICNNYKKLYSTLVVVV
jgi:hypothetical protein